MLELSRQEDEAYKWGQSHSSMFVPTDEQIQEAVTQILQRYPELVDTRRNRSGADPFIIAVAKVYECTVVTGERLSGKLNKPHIPDVCSALGIRCLNLLSMFREQGWRL